MIFSTVRAPQGAGLHGGVVGHHLKQAGRPPNAAPWPGDRRCPRRGPPCSQLASSASSTNEALAPPAAHALAHGSLPCCSGFSSWRCGPPARARSIASLRSLISPFPRAPKRRLAVVEVEDRVRSVMAEGSTTAREKRNALNDEVCLALGEAFAAAAEADSVRVLVLRGDGDDFSLMETRRPAGAVREPGRPAPLSRAALSWWNLLEEMPKATIAQIHGGAIGGAMGAGAGLRPARDGGGRGGGAARDAHRPDPRRRRPGCLRSWAWATPRS